MVEKGNSLKAIFELDSVSIEKRKFRSKQRADRFLHCDIKTHVFINEDLSTLANCRRQQQLTAILFVRIIGAVSRSIAEPKGRDASGVVRAPEPSRRTWGGGRQKGQRGS
ncbi:hypothetical protein NPIL_490601 [Nephila pilipes]|uniref:Uncharacterized protein n=1 Tax=Nephila pilipes TaxID=299642 RepID=A0A8X6PQP1_NEPPI|nr:hypothetical protein NPIL_490601 [Nephila pilipes]